MTADIFTTDWLASRPVFYNERTGRVSHTINDVIDFANLEIHPEGFNNFLDFGYAVLGQTPVRDVKFLPHSSRLSVDDTGTLHIEQKEDPVSDWVGRTSHEDDVWHRLEQLIHDWETSTRGEIIIPTSGGYDSRLLNFFIRDKTRIRAFTYGLAEEQHRSFEVVYAQKLAEILGIRWQQIELGNYHHYLEQWDRLYGPATHAHGMYHLEFYSKILPLVSAGRHLLSGIIGDVWAGTVNVPEVKSSSDLQNLGYTHGLHADVQYSLLRDNGGLRKTYFERMQDRIMERPYSVVEAMRLKLILLSYLKIVPESFGFKPWSPFLDQTLALRMATLPEERRNGRLWQKQFFRKNGLDLESMNLPASRSNTLNHLAMERVPLPPLDTQLLGELVREEYVAWINQKVRPEGPLWRRTRKYYARLRQLRGGVRLTKPVSRYFQQRFDAYFAYLTLKPIESLLQRRNKAREES